MSQISPTVIPVVAQTVFARKKQCVYCNSYMHQNLRMRCSLNFEFETYDVIKRIFIFCNINKVTQHVN